MRNLFTNNAASALDADISDSDTTLTLATGGGALFANPTGGNFQWVTLSDPINAPGVYEVARMTARSSDTLTVVRESGSPVAWLEGAKVEARVAAEMLAAFVQNEDSNGLAIQGTNAGYGNQVAIKADSRDISNSWLIGGYPVLQLRESTNGNSMDRQMSVEVVGTTHSVELGTVPAWAASTEYVHGSVVQPTTPNGKQYRLELTEGIATTVGTSGTTEPTFGSSEVDFDGDVPGQWIPVDLATGFMACIFPANVRLHLSEVGFICDGHGASAAAYVSIGTADDGSVVDDDLLLANVQLTQVTAAHMRHKVAPSLNASVRGLCFKLNTAATAGTFHGRFYWKGMFVETPTVP